jgi:hypothetical protein
MHIYIQGAVNFAKEAYDCVAITYNPVHPEVFSVYFFIVSFLRRYRFMDPLFLIIIDIFFT